MGSAAAKNASGFGCRVSGYEESLSGRGSASPGPKEREAAAKLFSVLTSLGDAQAVRENVKFDPAVFWSALVY
jgi:hypothetical protein